MAINITPGVGPQNSDIASAVAAPSAATIASTVAGSVPTISAINTSVSTYASPYGGTVTNLGTQNTNGSSVVTFSSLGGYKNLRLYASNVLASGNGAWVRINGDSGTNYYRIIAFQSSGGGYASGGSTLAANQWGEFCNTSNASFYMELDQTSSGGYKMGKYWSGWTNTYGYGLEGTLMWNSTAAITSISLIANGGTFTSGQAWMVGAS
jgi:hypothetical protein